MSVKHVQPEQYFLPPTPHVPNSRLPILVYRNVLEDTSPRNILNTIEPNGWIKGGQWKTYKVPHFHTHCHECYGIIRGGSTYLLGVGPNDPKVDEEGNPYGMKLTVQKGDVFVLPALDIDDGKGILEATGHRFDMNYGFKPPEETSALAKQSESVTIPPLDPLYGLDGPLPRLWKEAARSRARL
ncbi:hypothetical protein BDV11DRAFT_215298 [Aspergillus similis]